jgi:hypothetical protein
MTHRVFHNDPIPVNVMLLSLALIIGVALVGFVWAKSRQGVLREGLEEEAEGASERLMPDAEMNGVQTSDYGALNGNAGAGEERGRSRV